MLPKSTNKGISGRVRSENKLDFKDELSLAFDPSAFAALLQAVEHIRNHGDEHLPRCVERKWAFTQTFCM